MASRSTPAYVARGNILASRFVKIYTAANSSVVQADLNAQIVGISHEGTKYPPATDQSNLCAAEDGDSIMVYGDEDECLLVIGAGGCGAGDYLKSDANGAGIISLTTGTTAQNIGAQSQQTVNAGEKARVKVFRQVKLWPALS